MKNILIIEEVSNSNGMFYVTSDGNDWYETQKEFMTDTLKVMVNEENIIESYAYDQSALPVYKNCRVVEFDKNTHVEYGAYIFDGVYAGIKPDEFHEWDGKKWVVTNEAHTKVKKINKKQQYTIIQHEIKSATTMINTLQDELDLELSEDIAVTQEKLKQWKKYRVLCLKFINSELKEIPKKPD